MVEKNSSVQEADARPYSFKSDEMFINAAGVWECKQCGGRALSISCVPHDPQCKALTWEEPPIIGAGGGLAPTPPRAEAEAVWRRLYVDRMVERGIDRADAQACCDAGDVDFSESPADAADAELECWENDDGSY